MDWLPRECSGSGYQRLPLPTWGPVCTPGSLSNECMSVTSHWCHVGSRPCWAPACLATTAARYCDSGSAMPPLFTALRARAKARPRVYTASASSAPFPSPSHPVLPHSQCVDRPGGQPALPPSLCAALLGRRVRGFSLLDPKCPLAHHRCSGRVQGQGMNSKSTSFCPLPV